MPDNSYPKAVAEVMATLTDLCRHQKRTELVELLENAHAHFDATGYDNWNGGTTTWALRLEVPTILFAAVHPRLDASEKELREKLDFLNRLNPNDPLEEVTITPITSAEMALGQRMAASDVDIRRLWEESHLRLFLSHVSQHKIQVSALKKSLSHWCVSSFVAHEDIEPSLEWQNEISLALRSMQALVAIMTVDFHDSKWTDQELGWALGRGVPVIPIRLGADPYGFVGKIQAIRGALDDPDSLAANIVQALLRTDQTRGHMRRAIVQALEGCISFAQAKMLKNIIVTLEDFTAEEKERLRLACSSNNQVTGSWGVVDAISSTFGFAKEPPPGPSDEFPF